MPIKQAAKIINESDALLIVAGAGMGVDSGLPDFRGSNGLYNAYPPFSQLGSDYMEMTRPSGFRWNPSLAWGFWGYQLNLYRKTNPHQGFHLLYEIAESKQNCFVQTTNVDGQFQKAGFRTDRIHECHGSIHRLQCQHPCSEKVWSADTVKVEIDPETMCMISPLPVCPDCGTVARPNIFMFGDTKYIWDFPKGHATRYRNWLSENKETCIAIIECGCGTVAPGMRNHSEEIVRDYPNAKLIRINPENPEVPDSENFISLKMNASLAIREIASFL